MQCLRLLLSWLCCLLFVYIFSFSHDGMMLEAHLQSCVYASRSSDCEIEKTSQPNLICIGLLNLQGLLWRNRLNYSWSESEENKLIQLWGSWNINYELLSVWNPQLSYQDTSNHICVIGLIMSNLLFICPVLSIAVYPLFVLSNSVVNLPYFYYIFIKQLLERFLNDAVYRKCSWRWTSGPWASYVLNQLVMW